MAKIILICAVFLALVIALGILTAKLNDIELGKKPDEMSEQSLAKYLVVRPFLMPAELFIRLVNKIKK